MVFSLLGQRSDEKPESAIRVLEITNAILHEMASKVYMSTTIHIYTSDPFVRNCKLF
jgi:hypothetical protein